MDPICTFLFSILVLGTTLTILRDVILVLMEGNLDLRALGVWGWGLHHTDTDVCRLSVRSCVETRACHWSVFLSLILLLLLCFSEPGSHCVALVIVLELTM